MENLSHMLKIQLDNIGTYVKWRQHEEHPICLEQSILALKPLGWIQLYHVDVSRCKIMRPDDRFWQASRPGSVEGEERLIAGLVKRLVIRVLLELLVE